MGFISITELVQLSCQPEDIIRRLESSPYRAGENDVSEYDPNPETRIHRKQLLNGLESKRSYQLQLAIRGTQFHQLHQLCYRRSGDKSELW